MHPHSNEHKHRQRDRDRQKNHKMSQLHFDLHIKISTICSTEYHSNYYRNVKSDAPYFAQEYSANKDLFLSCNLFLHTKRNVFL